MLFFSFGNLAFNCTSGENNIDMLIAAKSRFATPQEFLADAIRYLDEIVYPGCNIQADYEDATLKDGQYSEIVEKWISGMDTKVEIKADSIERIRRLKRAQYDPMCDEFLLETADEYILFLWSTSA